MVVARLGRGRGGTATTHLAVGKVGQRRSRKLCSCVRRVRVDGEEECGPPVLVVPGHGQATACVESVTQCFVSVTQEERPPITVTIIVQFNQHSIKE